MSNQEAQIANKEIKRASKRLLWVSLALLVGILLVSAVEWQRAAQAKELLIDIEEMPNGRSWITKTEVMKSLERAFVYKLTEVPIGEIDFERVERALEEEPFVKKAEVFADASNRIHIELTQREPLLRIIDERGDNYYLDEEGRKMPLSKHFSARVLVATGHITPFTPDYQNKKKHRVKDLYQLAKHITEDNFLKALVEQVYVREDGDFVFVPKIGRHDIVLGNMVNWETKIENLKTFYQKAIPHQGWQKYRSIDLRFKNQVVCQKR